MVSIHAPLKGATWKLSDQWSRRGCFNSRTPKGCDLRQARKCQTHWSSFNSRTPKGCDVARVATDAGVAGFNSRTPKGCDSITYQSTYQARSFNSRTPKGCDFQFFIIFFQ